MSYGPYDRPNSTVGNHRFYHHFCMECTDHFDCEYNYLKHREIIHNDFSGISNTLGLVNTKEADSST